MTYYAISELTVDPDLGGRVEACVTEQSMTFKDDTRTNIVACAQDCLRANEAVLAAFTRLAAVAPGLADKATAVDGTVSSDSIEDGDILAAVQANYPLVAELYYGPDTSGG